MKTSRRLLSVSAVGLCCLGATALLAACGEPLQEEETAPEGVIASEIEPSYSAQAVTPAELATVRADMLKAVNAARAVARKCGTVSYPARGPLKANAKLDLAAQKHTTDMMTNNYFSHTGKDGSQPWVRFSREGYNWSAAGENIAAGNSTVTATMTQWLNSPGHCANIMGANFTEIGIGFDKGAGTYKYYWTQAFAKPR